MYVHTLRSRGKRRSSVKAKKFSNENRARSKGKSKGKPNVKPKLKAKSLKAKKLKRAKQRR